MPSKKRPPRPAIDFNRFNEAGSSHAFDTFTRRTPPNTPLDQLLVPSEVRSGRPVRGELPHAEVDAWEAFCKQHALDPVEALTAALRQYRRSVEEESA